MSETRREARSERMRLFLLDLEKSSAVPPASHFDGLES